MLDAGSLILDNLPKGGSSAAALDGLMDPFVDGSGGVQKLRTSIKHQAIRLSDLCVVFTAASNVFVS